MNGEQKFWLGFWIVMGITLCVFSFIVYASHKHKDSIVQDMVEQGYSPIEARCAFAGSTSDSVCISFIHKGDK